MPRAVELGGGYETPFHSVTPSTFKCKRTCCEYHFDKYFGRRLNMVVHI